MVTIENIRFIPGAQPMAMGVARVQPRREERRFWIIELTDSRGRIGLGEAAPWPSSGVSSTDLGNATASFEKHLAGRTIHLSTLLSEELKPPECSAAAAHGFEQALFDLVSQDMDTTVERLMCRESKPSVRTHVLVHGPDEVEALQPLGIKTLKVKGGHDLEADDARLSAIRAVAPQAAIRLDINGSWSREQAAGCLDRLSRHNLEWVEQPTPADDLESLAWLRDRFPMSIAADESVVHHHASLISEGLVDVIIIKPMFLGGLIKSRRIATRALEGGCRACVTHALESPVGRRGALALASSLATQETHGVSPLDLQEIEEGMVYLDRGCA
jgi:o-succinylbenzoate synthase